MDEGLRDVVGSKSRDAFRHWHKKELPGKFYSTDIDLAFIGKYPPRLIAVTDFKVPGDIITFSEVICYNWFASRNIPVFIISSKDLEEFTVERYTSGNWRPNPCKVKCEMIKENISIEEFEKWEGSVRNEKNTAGVIRRGPRKDRKGSTNLDQYT